jgi:aryl-alcohol dehydrogenase-like predicted oxidoreductase
VPHHHRHLSLKRLGTDRIDLYYQHRSTRMRTQRLVSVIKTIRAAA